MLHYCYKLKLQQLFSEVYSQQCSKFITYLYAFYYDIEIFRMFKKCESKTEKKECMKKVYLLHLRLNN